MKRVGNLWDRIVSWDNLLHAASKAKRGKRSRPIVLGFEHNLEPELLRLSAELKDGSYQPGPFTTHWIHTPKPRLISAAPYRDRVVHHAVMNVLEPILDRRFHPDSYACRKGKGSHAAADRLQHWMRRREYALQCDVRKFFPSIDRAILKSIFRRAVKDRPLLELLDLIVDNSNDQERVAEWFPGDDLLSPLGRRRGIPIGNLTSQWFANWYLDGLDHFITSRLRLGAYARYCDDFIVLSDDRTRLREARAAIIEYLHGLRLKIHDKRATAVPVRAGVHFVGFRVWPHYRLLKNRNVRDFRRRLRWMQREYAHGRLEWEDLKRRIDGWLGHARQANTGRLLNELSKELVFHRGEAE